MAKRGSTTYKGTGVNAGAGAAAAKAATPGTAKAKPSAKARANASPNAAFKRTGPVKVNAAKAKKVTAPRSMRSPDASSPSNRASGAVMGPYATARPKAAGGIDPGKFFGEVIQNVRNLPGVSDLQRASGGIPSPAQSKRNNDALRRAVNRR